jgi:hypothetical protein
MGQGLQRHVSPVRLPDAPLPRLESRNVALVMKLIRPSTVPNWRLCMASITAPRSSEPVTASRGSDSPCPYRR